MSSGPRLPLARAQDAAKALMTLWHMPTYQCMVVGSVRRLRPDVGDLEFVAPLPVDPSRDTLYDAIAPTLKAEGLFPNPKAVAVATEGFKRGFKCCSLLATLADAVTGTRTQIPVQINRYAHDEGNRGWIEIMRTGPAEFGPYFLGKWKQAFNIQRDRQASIDGHLVDAAGDRVRVASEADAFRLCRMPYIEPHLRDNLVANLRRS